MRVHRFYVPPELEFKQDFWFRDERLLHQWGKVLRFRPGQDVVLFDGIQHERLYKIIELNSQEAHLQLVTEYKRKLPSKDLTLFWALLKKDMNDWVLQKCTELGVSHFVPLLAERSEKTGFDIDRAKKIVIEASEQCGRSDIPTVREPMHVQTALDDYRDRCALFICEQGGESTATFTDKQLGVLVGPEGGWSDKEKELFKDRHINELHLHDFTLRAETACAAVATKLIQ